MNLISKKKRESFLSKKKEESKSYRIFKVISLKVVVFAATLVSNPAPSRLIELLVYKKTLFFNYSSIKQNSQSYFHLTILLVKR